MSQQLSFHDRQRLRVIVKQMLMKNGVPAFLCTDYEADKYIAAQLEETAQKLLKAAVDAKMA